MASYIKYLFKTVRKFFGEAVVVTQEVDDITLRGRVKVRVQRVDSVCDRAPLALLVRESFQIGELCEQRLLLVGGNGVVDGLREVGGVVADPMRGLEVGDGLTVVAVVVVVLGGGELLGDILCHLGPGIEIRLAVVGGGRLLRHRGADKQRGERDHQRGDERGETAGSRDARTARIVGTGCDATPSEGVKIW